MSLGEKIWSSKWRRVIFLGFLLLIYTLVGAAVFVALESTDEETRKRDLQIELKRFANETGISAGLLRNFTERYRRLAEHGAASSVNNWEFGASFFFALTVVTTIGYGTISPATTAGQAFCMVFAMFGIPLTAVLLAQLGSFLSDQASRGKQKLEKCLGHRQRLINSMSVFTFVSVFGSFIFLIVPALIFRRVEGWTFWQSLYCAFITLTTIGFGDFVPAQQPNRIRGFYKTMLVVWIVFGLAFLALIIGILGDHIKHRVDEAESKVIKIKRKFSRRGERVDRVTTETSLRKGSAFQDREDCDSPKLPGTTSKASQSDV